MYVSFPVVMFVSQEICSYQSRQSFVFTCQGRSKSLSEFFYTARNATSMYFSDEPSTADVEVSSELSCQVINFFNRVNRAINFLITR